MSASGSEKWLRDASLIIASQTLVHEVQAQYVVRKFLALYRVYQNDWSGFEVDYIHKYGEQNYKY